MKNRIEEDWFYQLKIETMDLAFLFQQMKQIVVFMLHIHPWILEDINLFESFSHLQDMIDVSNADLNEFIQEIQILDNDNKYFSKIDLLDEFNYIKENIHLESGYLTNMVNYIKIVINHSIHDLSIVEKLEQYHEIDISCYNQMKINNKELKKLKQERRDLFE